MTLSPLVMDIKYIDNDINNGIKYDFDFIGKEYKKLKCPRGFFNLDNTDIRSSGWIVAMSPRSTSGKTTSCLLYGLLLWRHYNCRTCLVRSRDYMITKKLCGNLYDVILENGYVSKIFGDEYNSIQYFGGKFFLVKIDEDGNIEKKEEEPFCILFSVQSHQIYKSSQNSYKNDFVVFDEFIGDSYAPEEFEHFMDLLYTLFRLRRSGRVILLSNTVDKHSMYFKELCIFDDIKHMEYGDSKTITSPLGTRVNVNMLQSGDVQKKMRDDQVRWFFGFDNPKVQALTGNVTWAIKNYPHIRPTEFYEDLKQTGINRYLELNGQYVRLEVIHSANLGLTVHVTRANAPKDGTPIYVCREIEKKTELYKTGHTNIDNIIWELFRRNMFYYGTNEEGYLVERYIRECKERG